MKCILLKKYDDLQKMFGFDPKKHISEVEKYLGKKLQKPTETAP